MGDYKSSSTPTHEGEQHLIAAARHIMQALRSSSFLTDDLRKTLSDLESHLSAIAAITESKTEEFSEFEKRLKSAEEKVFSWESNNQIMIWDSGPVEASNYLKSIDEIQTLIQNFTSLSVDENGKHKELFYRADSVLQLAMSRLEEELIHILVRYKQYPEPEYMSFRLSGADIVYDESFVSVDEESIEEASQRNRYTNESDDYYVVDLVQPLAIPHLKSIAKAMFASNYGYEFCHSFINTRKYALDEYLVVLGVQIFSIEDVLKMEWTSLNLEIKKWSWIMKIIIRVYLASEKWLCEQILAEFGSVSSFSFLDISKATMACLLNFGEAIAMGSRRPEKLFSLLDMYEVLADLLLDIDALFMEETGSFIRIEFHELMKSLGNLAKTTFLEFGNAIATSNTSSNPFSGGGIHPLTRYVMNYIKTLTEYGRTLNFLIKDQCIEDSNSALELEDRQGIEDLFSSTFYPTAHHLLSITSTLKSSLDSRSKLYKDAALQHVFLMNNIHYMVQKVKSSKLMFFFGDEWIREHIAKVQRHATSYERATWSSVLSLLRDDNQQSHSFSKANFRERCRAFSIAFEEVYKSQTGWSIPDFELREGLQISTAQNVIQAYRTFVGRISGNISDKDVKYTVDDLEKYLFHLFEGSPRSLHHAFIRRR
ncbi:hypothetical protein L3X38_029629 [Prunus dulcis]|uniref:Exocyst subunit Exo70 family protein n=1 Tax=Prunus dulcis TaxID=3755 RepID=A0AAD4Z2E7_PRUDU|nr:hypothetical protein L3X38_029629 [Prunus dulcis]